MDRSGAAKDIKITVATLTRRRPNMLTDLITSWAAMEMPDGCEVRFVVVENDDEPNTKPLFDALVRTHAGISLRYAHEAEIGIPFARNAAARHAIEQGSDWLMFVDDDEVVAPDWLVRFAEALKTTDAVLLSGPVRVRPAPKGLSFAQRIMHDSMVRYYERRERQALKLANNPAGDRFEAITNNWAARTELFDREGLWFDETLRHSGGSDAKFSSDVRNRRLPIGWVPDAVVYETIPPERLSFGYQYRRARDQSTTRFLFKLKENPKKWTSLLFSMPVRFLGTTVLALLVPLTAGRTLLPLSRSAGWIAGRLGALAGRRSRLYARVTGN